jgi:hypothetical protein
MIETLAVSPHRTAEELEAALDHIRASPPEDGRLELIVLRPAAGERTVVDSAKIQSGRGVVGDGWPVRYSSRTGEPPSPDAEVTLMNIRAARAVAGADHRVPLAGDQLYVDLDLGRGNVPAGTRLLVGAAVLEVSEKPHTGCAKFTERFGLDALRWVSSSTGRELNLRGINCRVVMGGTVASGDGVKRQIRQ